MKFLPETLQKYAEHYSEPESDLLQKINRETHLHIPKPQMMSGHLQGRLLSMISHMIKPERILEIGTYTGYSTLCLAEGLGEHGKMITIDNNVELSVRTKTYFSKSTHVDKISMRVGNALEIIPGLKEKWDIVFIDADKENYSAYFDLVIDQTNSGGYLIADNVLWSGKVFDKTKKDRMTEIIRIFNKKVHVDPRVQNVLCPVRDGLMIMRKR